ELFIEGLAGGNLFQLFDRRAAPADRLDVGGRVMGIGPALGSGKGVRSRTKAQIGLATPVLAVVSRGETGLGEVGDFVLLVARAPQFAAGDFVRLGHLVVAWNRCGRVSPSASQQFGTETASFVNFE